MVWGQWRNTVDLAHSTQYMQRQSTHHGEHHNRKIYEPWTMNHAMILCPYELCILHTCSIPESVCVWHGSSSCPSGRNGYKSGQIKNQSAITASITFSEHKILSIVRWNRVRGLNPMYRFGLCLKWCWINHWIMLNMLNIYIWYRFSVRMFYAHITHHYFWF